MGQFNKIQFKSIQFRLLWGTAGASNALAIARTLGFDSSVIAEAEKVAAAGAKAQEQGRTDRSAALAESLQSQVTDVAEELESRVEQRKKQEKRVSTGVSAQWCDFDCEVRDTANMHMGKKSGRCGTIHHVRTGLLLLGG